MKTINTKLNVVFTMLLGMALLFTNNIATGQSRSRGERKPQDREYTRTGTRHERDRGNNKNHGYNQGERRNNGKEYQKHNNYGKHHKQQKHNNYNKHHKNHKSSVTVYWNIPKHYYRNHWDYQVYHRKPWRHHHHRPVVLHHQYGKIYYHDSRFYRYDNIYGYVVIEQPSHMIFTTVPAEFNRVRIRGNIYFKHRDIWMERTPRGYRLWRG
ncbi:hypothetical protein ACFLU5_12715 [Bacteroidota bacterium]